MATFFLSLEQFLRRFQRFLPLSRRVQKHKIFGLGFPLLEKFNGEVETLGRNCSSPGEFLGDIWPAFDAGPKAELKFWDPAFRPLRYLSEKKNSNIFSSHGKNSWRFTSRQNFIVPILDDQADEGPSTVGVATPSPCNEGRYSVPKLDHILAKIQTAPTNLGSARGNFWG